MNRTPRLSKTGIEYLDYVWNFYSGCWNGCSYCWARPLTVRFKDRYPNGFNPTVYPEALLSPLYLKKPSVIGCAFMGDLFGIDPNRYVGDETHVCVARYATHPHEPIRSLIYSTIRRCPQHTFVFLTKQPQNLYFWSPFPDNCRVGVTVTSNGMMTLALTRLVSIAARVKFLSIEPLLGSIGMDDHMSLKHAGIKQVIIGACTGTKMDMQVLCQMNPGLTLMPWGKRWTAQPAISWVREIVEAADRAGAAVFLKDNLKSLMTTVTVIDAMRYDFWAEFEVSAEDEARNIIALRQEIPDA